MKIIVLLLIVLILAPFFLEASGNINIYKELCSSGNSCNSIFTANNTSNYFAKDNTNSKKLPPPEVGRIIGQFLLGPIVGSVFGYAGGNIGAGIEAMTTSDNKPITEYTGFAIGALIGYSLGNGIAIILIGNTDKVKGNFFSATCGTGLGLATYCIIMNILYKNESIKSLNTKDYIIILGGAWLIPTGLGVLSYYLTRQWRNNTTTQNEQGINVDVPTLTVRQNPYKINPAPMVNINLLTMHF